MKQKITDLDELLSNFNNNTSISVIKTIHNDLKTKRTALTTNILEEFLNNDRHFLNCLNNHKKLIKYKKLINDNLKSYKSAISSIDSFDNIETLVDQEKLDALKQQLTACKDDLSFFLTKTRYHVETIDCNLFSDIERTVERTKQSEHKKTKDLNSKNYDVSKDHSISNDYDVS
ncbi:hypothetical protein M153_2439900054, partial [Pseudoloma neurophilia]